MPRKKDYKKYREQTIRYNKEWAKRNPEKVKEYNRKYRQTEARKKSVEKYDKSEKGRKRRKEWYKRTGKYTEYTHKRRAIIKNLTEHFTLSEWEELKKKWNYRCLACGKQEPEIRLTPDHIIPLKVGGKNTIDNIQPLCSRCNSRKNIKIIDYRLIVK